MRVIPCLSTSNLFKHSVYECHMEATRNIFLRDYSNHQKYKLKINVAISMCAILTEDLYIICKNGEHLSSYYTVADVSWFVSSFTIKCFPNFLLESTILLNICRVLPSYKSQMSHV